MSPGLSIAIVAVLAVALIECLVFVLTRPPKLEPHRSHAERAQARYRQRLERRRQRQVSVRSVAPREATRW